MTSINRIEPSLSLREVTYLIVLAGELFWFIGLFAYTVNIFR